MYITLDNLLELESFLSSKFPKLEINFSTRDKRFSIHNMKQSRMNSNNDIDIKGFSIIIYYERPELRKWYEVEFNCNNIPLIYGGLGKSGEYFEFDKEIIGSIIIEQETQNRPN